MPKYRNFFAPKSDAELRLCATSANYMALETSEGNTALICAVKSGNIDTVQFLFSSGYCSPQYLLHKNNNGETALITAALTANLTMLKTLLESPQFFLAAITDLLNSNQQKSFTAEIKDYLDKNPLVQIVKKLLSYRQLSITFWRGWMRHHSPFIQSLLDHKEIHTLDEIKQAFTDYVQTQQACIDQHGDFSLICRDLGIALPTHAIKNNTVFSLLDEMADAYNKFYPPAADRYHYHPIGL